MNRAPLVLGATIVATVASVLACNFPAGPTRGLSVEAIQLTMDAVTPLATVTSAATIEAGPGPTSTPFRVERPFPNTDPPGVTFEYETRSGDTLAALAGRFGVDPGQIAASPPLPATGYVPIAQKVQIANVLGNVSPGGELLPDAELVYSPTASDFDVQDFVAQAGGYLSRYVETLDDGSVLSGAAIVHRVADENSVNPRLLLALLETQSDWVYGTPADADARDYPIGFRIPGRSGLYEDLTVAAEQLNRGYYGWRAGTFRETTALDRGTVRWNPTLNAGSVALLHLSVLLSGSDGWLGAIVGAAGFLERFPTMFGDPWSRADAAGPVLPPGLEPPVLELPFGPGENWSLTAGPHNSWSSGTPRGALDFSPITGGDPCAVSVRWVTASAPGVVVRAQDNTVALDLDGDGKESTGWVLLYYHLAEEGLIPPGTLVATGRRSAIPRAKAAGRPGCTSTWPASTTESGWPPTARSLSSSAVGGLWPTNVTTWGRSSVAATSSQPMPAGGGGRRFGGRRLHLPLGPPSKGGGMTGVNPPRGRSAVVSPVPPRVPGVNEASRRSERDQAPYWPHQVAGRRRGPEGSCWPLGPSPGVKGASGAKPSRLLSFRGSPASAPKATRNPPVASHEDTFSFARLSRLTADVFPVVVLLLLPLGPPPTGGGCWGE